MIRILRFLRGYIYFSISGSLPEQFLNVLNAKGISVWNVKSYEGVIYCKTLALNYRYICRLSRNKNISVHVKKKRGLPFFFLKNKKRAGIPIGTVCFVLIFTFLSKFIWCINIYGYEKISYCNARSVMENLGVYEGTYGKFDSLINIQTKALMAFSDVSWITINTDGSTAEVKITEMSRDNIQPKDKHYNIVSKYDGQIIRADVQKGMSYVQSGDAVVKGSLLIGGFVQTDLGSTILDTAQGVVLAKTFHEERFVIPKKYEFYKYEDSFVTRKNACLFGLRFPLDMRCTDCERNKISFLKENELDFKGKTAPVALIREHIFYIDNESVYTGEKLAENNFKAERLLCELFSYSDKKITGRNVTKSADDDNFYYDIKYSCEEDIGEMEEIILDDNFSYDGSISIEN